MYGVLRDDRIWVGPYARQVHAQRTLCLSDGRDGLRSLYHQAGGHRGRPGQQQCHEHPGDYKGLHPVGKQKPELYVVPDSLCGERQGAGAHQGV